MNRIIRRIKLMLVLVSILCLSLTSTASADTVLDGTTDGGAFFRIIVPTAWNGDLVIWNHGFSLAPVGPVTDLGPLAGLQLFEGYAVAASSYQQLGWALFKTKNDLQNLVGVFKANFGTPGQIFLNGASLGGIVTAHALEKANLGNVVGAYPICGALAGSRNWDAGLDLRLIYDNVCGAVPGAAIPGAETGLPAPGFPGFPYSQTQMALAMDACTGLLVQPIFRTPAQAAKLAQILAVTQIPNESFLLTDMGFALFGMSNVIFDPAKLDGGQGIGNVGAVYSDAAINASIQRVSPNPGAANRLRKAFTPKGNVGDVKIVSLHTDEDGLVVIENEKEYQDVVPASNLTVAVVDEAVPSHCGFTDGIDPGFVIPDMDGRVPPR